MTLISMLRSSSPVQLGHLFPGDQFALFNDAPCVYTVHSSDDQFCYYILPNGELTSKPIYHVVYIAR